MPLQAVPVNITAFRWMPLIKAFTAVLALDVTLELWNEHEWVCKAGVCRSMTDCLS